MIRVVHLFDLKRGVEADSFLQWLDAKLGTAARQFGCTDRKTWVLLDGFEGTYLAPRPVHDRPRYVNEAYWTDAEGPQRLRDWLKTTTEGQQVHHRWFTSIENHTVLRYLEGWTRGETDE
ncbi:MAG TPA: hypothetical protein VFE05_20255 [Longimicrobiaceae bacterium]|jgi:hypothetical protein|nr:hypothetical protein [Longimicrobiaceae bacterium]